MKQLPRCVNGPHTSTGIRDCIYMFVRLFAIAAMLLSQVSVGIAEDAAPRSSTPYTFDKTAQALKKEALEINRDLVLLSEEALIPTSAQLAVFLSLQPYTGAVDSSMQVKLALDGNVIANHVYTPKEQEALFNGGVHRLYFGNLPVGGHELVAYLEGNKVGTSSTTFNFNKVWQQKFIEVNMNLADKAPKLIIRDWQSQ